jgi:hypothetical protein
MPGTLDRHSAAATRPPNAAVAGRVLAFLRPITLRCLIIGHDDYLTRMPHRLFLRCGECGRCTRGWVIGMSPPQITAPVAPRPRICLALVPRTPTAADAPAHHELLRPA